MIGVRNPRTPPALRFDDVIAKVVLNPTGSKKTSALVTVGGGLGRFGLFAKFSSEQRRSFRR
jgi:hypothetical protein